MYRKNAIRTLGFLLFPIFSFSFTGTAQNISGEKIIIGRESITIINFPDKVLNINFSDDGAYEYYTPKRREERSISIQFNKEKETGPNTNLLVNEGGRSHMFRLIFDSTYNINDDSRPPLWYDHSDLRALRAFVQKLKEEAARPKDDASLALQEKEKKEQERKEAEERKIAAIEAQKQQEADAIAREKELEKQRAAEAQAQKEHAATLAKAKKDAAEKEKQAKLAAQKEAEARKIAEDKARKDAEVLAKKKAEEEKRIAELTAKREAEARAKEKELNALKAKQDAEAKIKEQELKELQAKKDAEAVARARVEQERKQKAADEALAKARAEKEIKDKEAAEALAKVQRDAEERQRLEQERLVKQRAAEEEKQKLAEAEAAKREAERIAAKEHLAKLEEERQRLEVEKQYSEVGLWRRYGSKGIDLYNFPREHVPTVISDFYIAEDTLRNFAISDSILKVDIPDKLNLTSEQPVNKGVNITLENMVFKDIQTFYKLKVENTTDEDFLLGRTYMYWYDRNNKAKQIIKSTYITYINFFPIVRPKSTQYIVFATRSPNMLDEESMVLFVDERRKEKGSANIVISGAEYNRELAKVQAAANTDKKGVIEEKQEPPAAAPSKKSRRNKKG